ncbi:MAG: glycoside hydrolase N-terminal domain-containing protein [Kiritimatiellia bacterium]
MKSVRVHPNICLKLIWTVALASAGNLWAQTADLPKVKEIRLEKQGGVLSVAELKVVSGGKNIARDGKAEQSSTVHGGEAGLAVDGNTEGNFFQKSVTHTNPGDTAPWWRLTFPEARKIEEVEVWNRTEAETERMDGVRLSFLDESGNIMAGTVLTNVLPSVRYRFTGNELAATAPNLLAEPETSFASVEGNPGRYRLHYDRPAPIDLKGWEHQSLPLGNGHFGVSFFGGTGEECWQFTEKSFCVKDDTLIRDGKAWASVALSDLLDLHLIMDHGSDQIEGYGRELELDHAIGRVRYLQDGVEYRRELFASYPDKVFAARLTASKPGRISFQLRAVQPYLGSCRTGTAVVDGSELVLGGITQPYQLAYEIRIRVRSGGNVESQADGANANLRVTGADEAEVYVTLGTSTSFHPGSFWKTTAPKKLEGLSVPSERIKADLASAGFQRIRHLEIPTYRGLLHAFRARRSSPGRGSGIVPHRPVARRPRTKAEQAHLWRSCISSMVAIC